MLLIKSPMSGAWVTVGGFAPFMLPIGSSVSRASGRLLELPLT
jgi:hypothetical protein